jgi:hypothetical protein
VPILKAFLFRATLLLLYTAIGEGFGKEMKEVWIFAWRVYRGIWNGCHP